MLRRFVALLALAFSTCMFAATSAPAPDRNADAKVVGTWEPPGKQQQVAIWPGAIPDANLDTKSESTDSGGGAFDVSVPTMTLYRANGRNTHSQCWCFPVADIRPWP